MNTIEKFHQDFSISLLNWYHMNGRKCLPWKKDNNPYKIWISEVMLQQTQVSIVVPYFKCFVSRFPDVHTLATAEEDEVLYCWAGLGYYARARHLHHAAKHIIDKHNGKFPDQFDQVINLPGVGRSTAGAILAFSYNQRYPILDGNVKRVLTRYFAISGYPEKRKINQILWKIAEQLTPSHQVASYTQAIMDLGSTVCTRSNPHCFDCPIQSRCAAFKLKEQKEYPYPKLKKQRREKFITMLIIQATDNQCLMVKRPETGIWGGLWCLPEVSDQSVEIPKWCVDQLGLSVTVMHKLHIVKHSLSHYDLGVFPVVCHVSNVHEDIMDIKRYLWYDFKNPPNIALPKLIEKIFAVRYTFR